MKRVTMQDVAEKAGVSKTTVSFILNDAPGKRIHPTTRKRVLSAATDLGYVLDSSRQTQTVNFLVRRPVDQMAGAAFLIDVMRGLARRLDPAGYQVSLAELPPDQNLDYSHWIERNSFAALAVDNPLLKDSDTLQQLVAQNIPLITLGQTSLPNVHYVGIDNVQAAFHAVKHLLDLGHRRIAAITYAPVEHIISFNRLQGYHQALTRYSIGVDESLVRHAHFTTESGYEAMHDLLQSPTERPTAVFISSDLVALGAIQALREKGLNIPNDMSVVGFDDAPLVQFLTPPLTTVRRPALTMGEQAGELLLKALQDNTVVNQSILLSSHLVIRNSTAKLGKGGIPT
jgi:LacI family transcriptional regulator